MIRDGGVNDVSRLLTVAAAALCSALVSTLAAAQQNPDAGTLLREIERGTHPALPRPAPQVVPAAPAATLDTSVQVEVKGFRVRGATLIAESELVAALKPWTGRRLSFAELQKAADAIVEIYRARGYFARAYLPEQDLAAGIVTIAIVEGRLGGMRIETGGRETRLSERTVRRFMLARQQVGAPVAPEALQRGTNLLNDLPGVKASSILEPGSKEGESLLAVKVEDQPLLTGMAQLDNTGVRSTGENRASGMLSLGNPFGIGDQAGLNAAKSQGSEYGRLFYALPLGGDGLRLGVAAAHLKYDSSTAGIRSNGTALTEGLNLAYPIRRGSDWNLNIAAAYDRKRFQNFTANIEISNKRNTISSVALSADSVDGFGGGGFTQGGLTYSSGKLELGRNAADIAADQIANGPARNGDYSKWSWLLSRLQRASELDTLWLSLSGQWAGKNLDSSEKIGIAGPYAVRAYAAGEAFGDDGVLFTAEWRRQMGEALQLVAFYDEGRARLDHNINVASNAVNTVALSGAGLGLNWGKPSDIMLRATVAWRLGSNPQRNAVTGLDANGTRRDPRGAITAIKTF